MKRRIINSDGKRTFENSWRRYIYRNPQRDISKFNACFFANEYVRSHQDELGVGPCRLGFDQCNDCGHFFTCNLHELRNTIINAIDFSAKHYRKQFKKGGAE